VPPATIHPQTVPSQLQQLSLSNVTFSNSHAYVGSVMFTEAAELGPMQCSPLPCAYDNLGNAASNYGQVMATPPAQFIISMPRSIRSGAMLPIIVTLNDWCGAHAMHACVVPCSCADHTISLLPAPPIIAAPCRFDQQVMDWIDTVVAVIDSSALLTGALRTFYVDGQASFTGLSMRGNASTSYDLLFTLTGSDLFGNDINSKQLAQSVEVKTCELGEMFDDVQLECRCAEGFGLVLADYTCRTCTAEEVVPLGSKSCAACPALSAPNSMYECECFPGYFGTIVGAFTLAVMAGHGAGLRSHLRACAPFHTQARQEGAQSARPTPSAARITRPQYATSARPQTTPTR
jgi:hypothetical protein